MPTRSSPAFFCVRSRRARCRSNERKACLVGHDVGIEFVYRCIAKFIRLQSLGDLLAQVPIGRFEMSLVEVVRVVRSVLNFDRPWSTIDVGVVRELGVRVVR